MLKARITAEKGALLSLSTQVTDYTKNIKLKRERAEALMADTSLDLSVRRKGVKAIEAEERQEYDKFMQLFRERKAGK